MWQNYFQWETSIKGRKSVSWSAGLLKVKSWFYLFYTLRTLNMISEIHSKLLFLTSSLFPLRPVIFLLIFLLELEEKVIWPLATLVLGRSETRRQISELESWRRSLCYVGVSVFCQTRHQFSLSPLTFDLHSIICLGLKLLLLFPLSEGTFCDWSSGSWHFRCSCSLRKRKKSQKKNFSICPTKRSNILSSDQSRFIKMWFINNAADLFAASFSWFCIAVFASPAWECRSFVGGRLPQLKKKMEERVSAWLLADASSRPVAEAAHHRSGCLYWPLHCYVIKSITSSISISFHAFHSHSVCLFFRSSLAIQLQLSHFINNSSSRIGSRAVWCCWQEVPDCCG